MKKKFCHVFFGEYPHDTRVRRYVMALLEQGYKGFIISTDPKGLPLIEKYDNLVIYRLPISKRRSTFLRRLYEYIIVQIFITVMVTYVTIRHAPKIFHVHTLPDCLVFSCLFPKLLGAKVILDFHELFPEFMIQHKPSLSFSSPVIKLILFIERISFKFADYIITFHDPAKEILLNRIRARKKVTTIMNGADIREIPSLDKVKTKKFKLIYNGTINYNLNLTLVVKALHRIKENYPKIYQKIAFYLYGEGPDLNNILSLARELKVDNVHYIGRLEFTDMMKELTTASACVLPPKKDTYSDLYYSIKLTEMIYFKIPVIATRLNTYQHYYPENCLIYFNSNDINELAEKIIFVLRNQNNLEDYANNALQEYMKYRWEIMEKRYISLINEILSSK